MLTNDELKRLQDSLKTPGDPCPCSLHVYGILTRELRGLLARLEAAEVPLRKARHTLCHVAQLLDGWHSDVAWTEWDESVRKAVSEIMLDIEKWRKSKGE